MRKKYKEHLKDLTCDICRKTFSVKSSYFHFQNKKGIRIIFCSRACCGIDQRSTFDRELIENNSIPVPHSGCWIWLGPIWDSNGYGRISRNPSCGGDIGAHRVSFSVYKGRIPNDKVVRHSCDTPLCVNPDHLLTGSVLDNKRDSVSRKRHAHGSKSWNSKVTENQIPEIRALLSAGISQANVARRFGVSHGIIYRIANNVTWKHVP